MKFSKYASRAGYVFGSGRGAAAAASMSMAEGDISDAGGAVQEMLADPTRTVSMNLSSW